MNAQTALSRDAERRLHREQDAQAAVQRRKRWAEAIARARAQGFSQREAPLAASAFFSLRVLRTEQPTVDEVRARVRAQHSHLYEQEAQ